MMSKTYFLGILNNICHGLPLCPLQEHKEASAVKLGEESEGAKPATVTPKKKARVGTAESPKVSPKNTRKRWAAMKVRLWGL